MSKKYTYEETQEIVKLKGFELLSKEHMNNNISNSTEVIFTDNKGYYYCNTLKKIIKNKSQDKFSVFNPYTIQNIKLWCKIENKQYELISDIYKGGHKILQWKCLKDGCMEIFPSTWSNIYTGGGCGFCHGKQVGLSNCLATKRPDVALEWHPTKNGDLTPYDVTYSSNEYVWWQCKDNPKHEWCVTINNRTNLNRCCPYCTNQLPSEDNNLLINNPELCKEWNYGKNDKLPEEYLSGSSKFAWWKCKECGNEWESIISSRTGIQNCGCPSCNKSKGEQKCKNVFINKDLIEIKNKNFNKLDIINSNHIYFVPQKTFVGLCGIGGKPLSYDFYLPKYNLLIEYQGNYHDGTARNQSDKDFKKQKEHDRRKKEYVLTNGYNFLEIWYWNLNKIEEILEEYLSKLDISI